MAENLSEDEFLGLFYRVNFGESTPLEKQQLEKYISEMKQESGSIDYDTIAAMTPDEFEKCFGALLPISDALVAKDSIREHMDMFGEITFERFREIYGVIAEFSKTKLRNNVLSILKEAENKTPDSKKYVPPPGYA